MLKDRFSYLDLIFFTFCFSILRCFVRKFFSIGTAIDRHKDGRVSKVRNWLLVDAATVLIIAHKYRLYDEYIVIKLLLRLIRTYITKTTQ